MDCQDLDYSFGYIEDASESDLSSVGYSQGINALTDETVDVTCTYVSYQGFELYFQDDGVSSVYVYAYTGTNTDSSSEDWSCSFDGQIAATSRRQKLKQECEGEGCTPTEETTVVDNSSNNGGFQQTAVSGIPYDTFRTVGGTEAYICAYEVVIYSPAGSSFAYSIYTDDAFILNNVLLAASIAFISSLLL